MSGCTRKVSALSVDAGFPKAAVASPDDAALFAITGQVLRAGKPVPDANVILELRNVEQKRVHTDAQGHFDFLNVRRFPIVDPITLPWTPHHAEADGLYRIHAEKDGYDDTVLLRTHPNLNEWTGDRVPMVLELRPATGLSGVVRLADGTPAANVDLWPRARHPETRF